MSSNILSKFEAVVVEGRNSGVDTLTNYLEGWRPKNPDKREAAVIALIQKLDEEGRAALLEVVRYCTDLSLFKLLSGLEEGRNGLSFKLSTKDDSSGDELGLIDDKNDNGLRKEYWKWVRHHGH